MVKVQSHLHQPPGTSDLAIPPTICAEGQAPEDRDRRSAPAFGTGTITTLATALAFDVGDVKPGEKYGPAQSSVTQTLCSLLMAMLVCFYSSQLSAQEIVVNADVRTDSLSRNEARLFFTMRLQSWPADNRPVKVFVLPDDNSLHISFTKTILGLFPYQLRRVWDRQLFSGTGQVPTMVQSEEDMLRRVAATPGAIGYLKRIPRDARVRRIEVR